MQNTDTLVGTPTAVTTLTPLLREIDADLETPVSVYLKLSSEGPAFLLESVSGGERVGRYSFVGLRPRAAFIIDGSNVLYCHGCGLSHRETLAGNEPLDVLREMLQRHHLESTHGLPRLVGGLVGYLSYDAARFFEPTLRPPLHTLPDGIFLLTDTLVAFDHARARVLAIAHAYGNTPAAHKEAVARLDAIERRLAQPRPKTAPAGAFKPHQQPSHDQAAFEAIVTRAKEHIAAGDIFQVVLSQHITRHTPAQAFSIYRALRRLNPSPYMFFFDFGGLTPEPLSLIGASPEMHVRLEGARATLRPIAGTRPRGETPVADAALEAELLNDAKERAEHVMLVDLGRNDLGRVCAFGSVQVTEMMAVERYSHVMHLVSQIEGRLRPEFDAFDLLAATFPAGTVSGAPKVRAMEIIAELEGYPRGPYAGVVGYFGFDGSMDTCIALRTVYMQGQRAVVQAGAGIVADSDPAREYEETLNKARALALAVDEAESHGNRDR